MQLWQRSELGPGADGVRRYGYGALSAEVDAARGPLTITARLTRFEERATVLGSRFGAALGGSGAISWFGDMGLAATRGDWRLGASYRHGWTQLGASTVRGASLLTSRALSADIGRVNLWIAGDSLSLRYAEPLRVTGGALALTLPGLAGQDLGLTPSGRERDWEAVYARPLGGGWITANAFWRQQPSHYAQAPDDLGAAVRYSFAF